MKARAPSTMRSACWLNISKKLPSRGSSLPNSIVVPLVFGAREFNGPATRSQSRPTRPHDRRSTPPSDRPAPRSSPSSGLECRRGERTLFAASTSSSTPARSSGCAAPTATARRACCAPLAGLSRPKPARIAWREPAAGGRALYLAHANALKDDLTRRRVAALPARAATAATPTPAALAPRSPASAWPAARDAPVRTPVAGPAPPRRAGAAGPAPAPATVAARRALRRARRRRRRDAERAARRRTRARGGSVVLTSHLPLTPIAARRRRMRDRPARRGAARRMSGPFAARRRARPAPGRAPPHRRAAADRLLHGRDQPVPARRRPRAADAAPDRARRGLGRARCSRRCSR